MAEAENTGEVRLTLDCIVCSSPFAFTKPSAGRYPRFCSDECREERPRILRPPAAHSRTCKRCGSGFVASKPTAELCSPACKQSLKRKRKKARGWKRAPQPIHWAKRNARRRAAVIEDVNPYLVFHRDGWRCKLCGCKTPRELRGAHHPRAPELDHILPLAKGGEHSYRNTQLACRECNGRKSDNPLGQLHLFTEVDERAA